MAQPTTSSRDEIIAAITDFYKFYIQLPYLDSDALVFAPENDGWPNVNAAELRTRGRSDEAVELLRHLPYLENPSIRGGWTIDDGSDCIQYHKGAFGPDDYFLVFSVAYNEGNVGVIAAFL